MVGVLCQDLEPPLDFVPHAESGGRGIPGDVFGDGFEIILRVLRPEEAAHPLRRERLNRSACIVAHLARCSSSESSRTSPRSTPSSVCAISSLNQRPCSTTSSGVSFGEMDWGWGASLDG